jgi:hypothetical protein
MTESLLEMMGHSARKPRRGSAFQAIEARGVAAENGLLSARPEAARYEGSRR